MLLLRRLGGATTITPSTVVVVLFRSVFWSLFLFLFLVLLLLLLMTLIALHRLAFCLLLFGQPTAETTRLGQHNTGTTRSWQSWLSSWQLLDPCLSLLCRFLVLAVHLLHFYKIYIYLYIVRSTALAVRLFLDGFSWRWLQLHLSSVQMFAQLLTKSCQPSDLMSRNAK